MEREIYLEIKKPFENNLFLRLVNYKPNDLYQRNEELSQQFNSQIYMSKDSLVFELKNRPGYSGIIYETKDDFIFCRRNVKIFQQDHGYSYQVSWKGNVDLKILDDFTTDVIKVYNDNEIIVKKAIYGGYFLFKYIDSKLENLNFFSNLDDLKDIYEFNSKLEDIEFKYLLSYKDKEIQFNRVRVQRSSKEEYQVNDIIFETFPVNIFFEQVNELESYKANSFRIVSNEIEKPLLANSIDYEEALKRLYRLSFENDLSLSMNKTSIDLIEISINNYVIDGNLYQYLFPSLQCYLNEYMQNNFTNYNHFEKLSQLIHEEFLMGQNKTGYFSVELIVFKLNRSMNSVH